MPSTPPLFKPSKSETRAEETTRVATEIISADNDKRKAQKDRLQAARLEQQAKAAAEAKPEPKKKTRAKAKKTAG
ncbi:hypothetical protein [Pseudoroseicyclus aestuarii]|uniref:Uncharacterized protein n=1 Tax=Pseudoroseicyclus aestuarii TaxID=1795041 RepID=A0A318TBF0_9RHOB|nr:hypothetical protein [Pseudoroseicyclus aestuarii]PYE85658.1 hypothetical protein DFP88_101327 [Pseudoroseicyclus aestuarii]